MGTGGLSGTGGLLAIGAAGVEATGGTTGESVEATGGTTPSRFGQVQFGTLYFEPTPSDVHSFANASFQNTATAGLEDAGAITISTTPSGFQATLLPAATGGYGVESLQGELRGGETVVVGAAGGAEVPAFTASVTAPRALLLSTPSSWDGDGVVSVSRDADVVLSWERGEVGVEFVVQCTSGSCSARAPSETGTLTLSSSQLSSVPSGTEVDLFALATTSLLAGEYQLSVMAAAAVLTPDRTRRVTLVVE